MKIDMNKDYVITINREVGSGGRTVGRMLAQRLGVPFYDKALINALTEKYHLSVEEIEELKDGKPLYNQRLVKVLAEHYHLTTQELEQIKSHKDWDNFWKDATASTDMAATLAELTKNDGTPTTEDIYKAETEFLTKLASNGPCVMAGRSGYYVLRSHPNHVNVFIQASTEHRIARIMHRQQVSRQEAEDIIERVDRMREDYIRRYTGTTRYDTRNYDLVINMDGMTASSHIRPAEGETDTGVTICYNTVKDVKYVLPLISGSDICINPVNWHTDATPATLHDTITITVSPEHHVLVTTNYSASEYAPFRDFLNVGDIHSCEPWLYSECLQRNIAIRAREWMRRRLAQQQRQ